MLSALRKLFHYAVRGSLAFATWLVSFIIMSQIPAFSEVKDGVNTLTSPIPLLVPIALAIGVFVLLKKPLDNMSGPRRKNKKTTTLINPKTNLPIFEKDRIEAVESLSRQAALHYELAVEADSVSLFITFWNKMEEDLAGIEPYYGRVPSSCTMNAHSLCGRVKNKQWKLRDTIERAKDAAIADIRGEHRNNKLGRFNDFKEDIDEHRASYDAETFAFAQAAIDKVARIAGIGYGGASQNPEEDIDRMEGHAFEHWCANLLTKIGYTDVSVTRGSGDQGVDVLAQKDGIKYAVQCKCYSSDLGNTPVQEVLAGKKFYHCHVGAVMTNRHFTKGAKELAAETGILLWDRDWINRAIEQTNSR